MITGYLAPHEHEATLREELGAPAAEYGRLFLYDGEARPSAWAQNVWYDVREMPVPSIGQAAKALRAIQRNWALHDFAHHRRAALIVENLPKVSAKPLVFGTPAPAAPLGAFALIAPDRMLAASRCASPFPDGECKFVEDRQGPPSRAYLKLWEALTLLGESPRAGQVCVDLGASPGGWTWVLAKSGAKVVAVDKAELAPDVARMANVEFRAASAFALEPKEIGPVDWLFSDVICYPARLFDLVAKWRESGLAARIVCTLKFQGPTDHDTAKRFAAIPNSTLRHLFHNKHELTWSWSRDA